MDEMDLTAAERR